MRAGRTMGVVWTALLVAASGLEGQAVEDDHSVTDVAAIDDDVAAPEARTAAEGLAAIRAAGNLRIDGRLDEEAWSPADYAHGFVQQRPDEGRPVSEPTEVRVLVDDEALYIGAHLGDSEPSGIVARLARRDEAVLADWFYVFVDSYDDRRTAFGFGVSAAGVQRDLRVADDNREDPGWDAVWASSVARDRQGWTVEIRIPLSQLRFNATDGEARWGLNFRRDIARKNETAYWAPVPQGTDRFVSLFSELSGVDGLEPGRRIEVVPYTVARLTRAPGSAVDPFYDPNDPDASIGADVRVGLGSSLTLSATLNPDFGQVEADPATVNLTAFETFQQERRPFFVEGADIFALSFPFWPPFFYSRRVGRSPQGSAPSDAVHTDRPSATTILGALKLSGKTEGGWSIGALSALTGAERVRYVDQAGDPGARTVEPRTSYSVARVQRKLRDGASGVGAIVTATHRSLEDHLDFLHNSAFGFGTDAFHRFGDGVYIANLSVLGSQVRGSERAIERTQRAPGHYFQRPDADHVELDPTRTSLTGLSASGRVARVAGHVKWGVYGEATSPGYEINDLGFNPTLDHVAANAWLRYEDFTPGRVFRNWSLGTVGMMQRGWGGELRELTNDLGFHFQLRNYWGGGVWVMRHRPSWTATALRGGPALRRPGRWMGSLNVDSDRRRRLSGNGYVFWVVEDEGGGHMVNGSANLTLRPSERIDVRMGPTWSTGFSAWQYVGAFTDGAEPVALVGGLEQRTIALGTRLNYTVSPKLSLQLYARPFLATGEYRELREVVDAAARSFDARFRTFTSSEASLSDGRYGVDRDGDSDADLVLADPSYNIADMQLNAVLRWEYRPGSALFAVWTHDRSRYGKEAWALGPGLDRLMDAPARNVFQVKVSYWMGM